ncbi:hypothetical protein HOF92_14210 [bacterium]|jgi:hypothetical protein|nr:hypothetical protein [bacterium]
MKHVRLLRFIALAFLLGSSIQAEGFLQKAAMREARSKNFQRIFVLFYLEKSRRIYTEFVTKSSVKDFKNHLELSYFGNALLQFLSSSMHVSPSRFENTAWVRKNYLWLLNREFERMRKSLSGYFDSTSYEPRIYAITLRFAQEYRRLAGRLALGEISRESFRFQEGRLLEGVGSLDLNRHTSEAMRDLLFIEFQLMDLE